MADHSVRDHATWAASATARNVHCAGALALSEGVVDRESEAAAWGTACHQVSEKCLRSGYDASDQIGTTETTKRHKFEVDDEMATTAQEYIDFCRSTIADCERRGDMPQAWIEEKFSLMALKPPFDAGGTADFVLYSPGTTTLQVIDLKGGRGVVVDVEGNLQLRTYALGALLAHQGLAVKTVMVTIVQPRAPHKDGRIRSETFHVAELVEWTADLLAAMKRSKEAIDAHKAAGSNQVLLDEWRDKYLKPGKCTFCPVEGSCPALRKDALSVAAVWFDDFDQPRIGNSALDQSPEALARDLDAIPMLEDWVKARRALAHTLAEQGVDIPGYQLAEKIGNRKWITEDEGAAAIAIMAATGLSVDDCYVAKLKSPAQIEKATGAKGKPKIADLWEKPVTGTNLVSIDKSTRPPAKNTAERYFEAT